MTLKRPADDEQLLMNIEDLEWDSEQILQGFRDKTESFLTKVKEDVNVKTVKDKHFNGQMLLGLVMDYCEAINSDAVPSIDNSVTRLVQEEVDVIEQEAFEELKIFLDNELGLEVTSQEVFEEVVSRAQRSAVRTLQTNMARFLTFKEILEATKRFKQRISSSGILETHRALCYHQSFMYSLEVFQQSCDATNELLTKIEVENEDLANI